MKDKVKQSEILTWVWSVVAEKKTVQCKTVSKLNSWIILKAYVFTFKMKKAAKEVWVFAVESYFGFHGVYF